MTKDLKAHPLRKELPVDLKKGQELTLATKDYIKVDTCGPIMTGTLFISASQLINTGYASMKQ